MKNRKIVLVGCGSVGTSFLYASINQGLAQEYVLIDINHDLAEGNALDFADCNAVLEKQFVSVEAGDYPDCKDADIIVITAGRPQRPGETRLDMVADNARIMKDIALQIKASGFSGITIVASNPVDVMTIVYQQVTGYDHHRVLGSGTILDSSRLRRLVGAKLNVHPSSVHTYILGEHGDSSIVPWSAGTIMGKRISDYIEDGKITRAELEWCREEAVNMAYKIIEKKKSTFYGIGVALAYIARAIMRGENAALLIGAYLDGEYGQKGIYIGVPAIVNQNGWSRIITLHINSEEQKEFDRSCQTIKETVKKAFEAIDIKYEI
ncbi:L-lactate dehydrogenase [Spiroplasma eriocheiris]|uniref:L-lactate dehydrogenase n=1 Tax=Spiroplasma eriocheiris TaxID=315358 RepID=A0A0H3XHV8_9MOLU|nr:L-lactate dehydrogenase [Spiroplasma eriocheiris]AHF57943.1 L-lactate dehydrogenase [Spiroplasma eriocheiris CCTCC M 207170]AKM54383.1 L-lactate dehydrogenase [Spiroplasma eriocheiris]